MTPEDQTWPPPPDTPDPLTEYDSLLTAFVCALVTKPPLSRLSLVRELHKKTGLTLRQCLAFVNSYCDRNVILPPTRKPIVWGIYLTVLLPFAALLPIKILWLHHARSYNVTPTHAGHLAIRAMLPELDLVFFGIIFASAIFNMIFSWCSTKQTRRDAAYARDKMAR